MEQAQSCRSPCPWGAAGLGGSESADMQMWEEHVAMWPGTMSPCCGEACRQGGGSVLKPAKTLRSGEVRQSVGPLSRHVAKHLESVSKLRSVKHRRPWPDTACQVQMGSGQSGAVRLPGSDTPGRQPDRRSQSIRWADPAVCVCRAPMKSCSVRCSQAHSDDQAAMAPVASQTQSGAQL